MRQFEQSHPCVLNRCFNKRASDWLIIQMRHWGIKDEFAREAKGSLNDCCSRNLVNLYFATILEVLAYNAFYFGTSRTLVYLSKASKPRVCSYSRGYWSLNWGSDSSWKLRSVRGSLFKISVLLIDISPTNANEIDCFPAFTQHFLP